MKFYTIILSIFLCTYSCAHADTSFDSMNYSTHMESKDKDLLKYSKEGLKEFYADISIVAFTETDGHTQLILSNAVSCRYSDVDLFTGLNGWKIGNRVQIVQPLSGRYYLRNMSSTGYVPVRLNRDCSETKTVKYLFKNRNAEQVITSINLLLNDDSLWHVGAWSSAWMEEWQIGDRIVISPSDFVFGKATHLLINLDRCKGPKNKVCSSVRSELWNVPSGVKAPIDPNQRQFRTWDVTVDSLDIDAQSQELVLLLSNSMKCRSSLPVKQWHAGDRVTFSAIKDVIMMTNLSNYECLSIYPVNESDMKSAKIEKISNSRRLDLEDGSVWYVGRGGVKDWNLNDRIVVLPAYTPRPSMTTHWLINLDHHKEGSSFDYTQATLTKP